VVDQFDEAGHGRVDRQAANGLNDRLDGSVAAGKHHTLQSARKLVGRKRVGRTDGSDAGERIRDDDSRRVREHVHPVGGHSRVRDVVRGDVVRAVAGESYSQNVALVVCVFLK